MSKLVVCSNISKRFGKQEVLSNLSFSLGHEEFLAIAGHSGAGKSVLLRIILGLIEPDKGSVAINPNKPTRKKRKMNGTITAGPKTKFDMAKTIGVLFQHSALFDSLTVWENIGFAMLQNDYSVATVIERAKSLLAEVGLDSKIMSEYPSSLSGGMAKRVALARALAMGPKLLLCDEPTSGLDPVTSSQIAQLIRKTTKKHGAGCIVITHDMNLAANFADRVALLYAGKFVWHSLASQVTTTQNPYVRQFLQGSSKGPMMMQINK